MTDYDAAVNTIGSKVEQLTAAEIDDLMNEKNRQAGVTALSTEEYFASESGKANHSAGLYEITKF
ncbi:hypothetical protein, partial [Vibrio parahaemolyticus]|uniref:hypothetical protein n=1 Tax=Vibrio parahaemolyticus TaxID=670 RepID=UPI002111C67F